MRNLLKERETRRALNSIPAFDRHLSCYIRKRAHYSRSYFEFTFLLTVLKATTQTPTSENDPAIYSWGALQSAMRFLYQERVYSFYNARYRFESLAVERERFDALSGREFREHIGLLVEALVPEIGCVEVECSKAGFAVWECSLADFCAWHGTGALVKRCDCKIRL